MNPIDHAKLLLLMASKDIKALDLMIMPESVDDEIFGFHAQQAVEKTLKAWISLSGGIYAKNHDLSMLLLTLQGLGCNIENLKDLISLNAFAAQFRYEALETDDEPLDRQETGCCKSRGCRRSEAARVKSRLCLWPKKRSLKGIY